VAPPPQVVGGSAGWPLPGQDYANGRDAVDSTLRASSIGQVAEAWSIPTAGALTTAPLIVGNTVYAEDDHGIVVAADKSTGRTLWQSAQTGFTVGPEGVALGWGKVYAATADGVEALDARSGHVLWTRRLTQSATAGVDMQPTVIGHRVLIATVPVSVAVQFHGGDRGQLFAVDASSGKVDWSFDTVASRNLWGHPGVNSGGGAWYPPAIDTRTGIVYWGTANPAPFPGTPQYPNGSSRAGPNLYTDSTVALSLTTGRLLWYRQAVPHDLFDQDFVHALLVTVHRGAASRQIVVGTGKGGQLLGMNPATGRLQWQTSVGIHQNHSLTALTGPTSVMPGTYGGVLTPPAAAGGTVYVATLNAPSVLSPDQTAYFGGKIGTMNGGRRR
jgi:glucose dehydrogenase